MQVSHLIKEISKLPIEKRLYIVEKTMHSIRKEKEKSDMEPASELLLSEYEQNKELTIFTKLDVE